MKARALFATLIVSTTLAGCHTAPVHDFCLIAKPIYVDPVNDKLTKPTADAIAKHDEDGAAVCKWQKHSSK